MQLRINRQLSTAFYPETDGSTEQMNQVLEPYLRAFVDYTQSDWSSLLPVTELAINNRDSLSTGVGPFFLSHGYHMDLLEVTDDLRTGVNRSPIQ